MEQSGKRKKGKICEDYLKASKGILAFACCFARMDIVFITVELVPASVGGFLDMNYCNNNGYCLPLCITHSGSFMKIKHPLEHTWGFWMNTNFKKQWEENLVQLTKFSTVEDYWCLYHHMKQPSELAFGQDYSVFKEDIRPMWEDEANRRGGRWLLPVERRKELDWMWMDVVLLMFGENFEHNDLICGAVVNVRGKCKICVWTADSTKQKANKEIGRKLKMQLGYQGKLGYQLHDSQNNLYTV